MPYKLQKQYRYKEYDYSQDGFYFVTICCKKREMFFGNIKNEKMQLSEIGKITEKFWLETLDHFLFIKLDKFVIMPNHIHGIIEIDNNNYNDNHNNDRRNEADGNRRNDCRNDRRNEAVPRSYDCDRLYTGKYPRMSKISPKAKSLSVIIGSFKSITTKIINSKFYKTGFAWQPRFHDRIIRNNDELNRIRQYIIDNPLKWELERNNFENLYM